MYTQKDIKKELGKVQFLSPNEPITKQGILRVIDQIEDGIKKLDTAALGGAKSITMWSPNIQYSKGDLVLYFKEEREQKHPDVGKREFAFILVSTKNNNSSIPNYDMVDRIPNFAKSGWKLINPTSYLLQDMMEMKEVVKEVFKALLEEHVKQEHGLIGFQDIQKNLLRKDFSNLQTAWEPGKYSLDVEVSELENGKVLMKKSSNGILEYSIQYSFDEKANEFIKIDDKRYYRQKSPIWDESDQTIFSQKYTEDGLFSVALKSGMNFNNLRYGTNIFHKQIDFSTMFKSEEYVPFVNDEYMVFFDTYEPGQFVFGYRKSDIQDQDEPTWDTVVSMPMLMNKTVGGFMVILPIHTHFNSMQKYNIGVPWNNQFRVQVIGRYR